MTRATIVKRFGENHPALRDDYKFGIHPGKNGKMYQLVKTRRGIIHKPIKPTDNKQLY